VLRPRILGIIVTVAGVGICLLGVVMLRGPAVGAFVIGTGVTASGGFIVGRSLRPSRSALGAFLGTAGIVAVALSQLDRVPRDAPAFFFGGIVAAAIGIGILLGGFLRRRERR
jgi:hypothetical protein